MKVSARESRRVSLSCGRSRELFGSIALGAADDSRGLIKLEIVGAYERPLSLSTIITRRFA